MDDDFHLSEVFLEEAAGPDLRQEIGNIAQRVSERIGGAVELSDCGQIVSVRTEEPFLADMVADQIRNIAFMPQG